MSELVSLEIGELVCRDNQGIIISENGGGKQFRDNQDMGGRRCRRRRRRLGFEERE